MKDAENQRVLVGKWRDGVFKRNSAKKRFHANIMIKGSHAGKISISECKNGRPAYKASIP